MNDPHTLIQRLYREYTGVDAVRIEPITGSGSSRRYCRLYDAQGHPFIGVEGDDVEENRTFIYLARHFGSHALPVPQVLAVDDSCCAYLQTDLGERSLYNAVSEGRTHGGQYSPKEIQLLTRAMRLLPRIQIEGAQGLDWKRCYPQPSFDEEGMMFDLNYFKYCLLKLKGVEFNEVKLQADFRQLVNDLCNSDDPQGFLYRDFQARNIILGPADEPQLIDFQGGRRGPIYYDLASFLWQASAQYPEDLRQQLIEEYCDAASQYITLPDVDTFRHRLMLFVFFRMLQVLGAYGFRGLHQRKQHFIDSLPQALRQANEVARQTDAPYPYIRMLLNNMETDDASRQEKKSATNLSPRSCHSSQTAPSQPLTISIWSFSYKKGIPEDTSGNGGGYVFDCRGSHNPGRYEEYKTLTGLDDAVIRFIEDDGEVPAFLQSIYRLADVHVQRYIERGFTSLCFAFGCTGGQHRSVYCAQHLAEYLRDKYPVNIHLCHREQGITTEWTTQS